MCQKYPIFELKNVTKRFGNLVALRDINLTIYSGETVALIGSSGAGKSTLLQLLNGTLQPSEGEILAFGRNLSHLAPRKLRQVQCQIGTVYQQFYLVDNLRVIHNVNAGHLGRWPFFKALISLMFPLEVETATNALTKVGIADKLYAKTDSLSDGQKQRVALARVFVQDPLVILADEPIASLDPQLSQVVMDLLREMSDNAGKTLIISLHAVEFAQSHCDRIIGLKNGKIVLNTPTPNLSSDTLKSLYDLTL